MNTEDFVTYEQAIALKKLGFDEFVLYKYEGNTLIEPNELIYGDYNDDYMYLNSCSAPTLYQVQKWLFEKGYFVEVNWFHTNTYYFSIVHHLDNEKATCVTDENDYSTPSEALLAGITKALKNLEENG